MPARLAKQIEEATRQVASLETSWRIYRDGFPAAAAKVAAQLEDAYLRLADLERLAEERTR